MEKQSSNLNEALWRRSLTEVERAASDLQPELRVETRLTDALARGQDIPVPSNFTARVLAAVELEEQRAASASRHWSWRWLFPRLAVSTAILLVAGISIQRHEIHSQRMELAKNIAAVAVSQPTPSVDALENLEVIQRMNQAGRADGELLAALQ